MRYLIFFCWPILFLAPPVVIYLLRVRPKYDPSWRVPIIVGAIAAVGSMMPVGTLLGFFMLYIWAGLTLIFLVIHGIVWIVAAVKKKDPCVGGAVLTGVTMIVSGACLGNLLATILAAMYLVALFRSRYSF